MNILGWNEFLVKTEYNFDFTREWELKVEPPDVTYSGVGTMSKYKVVESTPDNVHLIYSLYYFPFNMDTPIFIREGTYKEINLSVIYLTNEHRADNKRN